jgi:hypothetical protein
VDVAKIYVHCLALIFECLNTEISIKKAN